MNGPHTWPRLYRIWRSRWGIHEAWHQPARLVFPVESIMYDPSCCIGLNLAGVYWASFLCQHQHSHWEGDQQVALSLPLRNLSFSQGGQTNTRRSVREHGREWTVPRLSGSFYFGDTRREISVSWSRLGRLGEGRGIWDEFERVQDRI